MTCRTPGYRTLTHGGDGSSVSPGPCRYVLSSVSGVLKFYVATTTSPRVSLHLVGGVPADLGDLSKLPFANEDGVLRLSWVADDGATDTVLSWY